MEFKQKRRDMKNEDKFHYQVLHSVRMFSKELILEMKSLVKAVVLFGSNAKNTADKNSDIDIMIVLDNISLIVTDELREAYRVIVNNLIERYDGKPHIMTVNYSDFWDMIRKGDPILINILRYGVPIYDTGIIEPTQFLLEIGKIRPTKEAVMNYLSRSETLFNETDKHIGEAILDLYYSTIDIVHSLLMVVDEKPCSPKEMPEIFTKRFKKTPLSKYSKTIRKVYEIAKKVEHQESLSFDGAFYDTLKKEVAELIDNFKIYIKDNLNKVK